MLYTTDASTKRGMDAAHCRMPPMVRGKLARMAASTQLISRHWKLTTMTRVCGSMPGISGWRISRVAKPVLWVLQKTAVPECPHDLWQLQFYRERNGGLQSIGCPCRHGCRSTLLSWFLRQGLLLAVPCVISCPHCCAEVPFGK